MIKRTILILLLLCSTSFAQEDVCNGVQDATITTGGSFALCWSRNKASDNVDHYKIFDNPTEQADCYGNAGDGDFGEEVHTMMDSDCYPLTCHTPMIPAMTTPGVHYLTVRGFDNVGHYSCASNPVILTVVLTVLPAENLRVRVISQ